MMALADDIAVQRADGSDAEPPNQVLRSSGSQPRPWDASLMAISHARKSKTSSPLEVNSPGDRLTIGELARRTGVTASALRYYEELGLLPAPARVSGQRRYPATATHAVGTILLYSDAGFTLAEQKALLTSDEPAAWQQIAHRKLAALDEQIARAQAARDAISHGLRCRHKDVTQCPNFAAGIKARLAGQSLAQAHRELHEARAGAPQTAPPRSS